MRRTVRHLSIAKWQDYQHYKSKESPPPWIKLHSRLLDDYEFRQLDPVAQLLALKLMLLASRHDNHLPCDVAWIAQATGLNGETEGHLKALLETGYLEPCGCEECLSLPEVALLKSHSRVTLEPHVRARASRSPLLSSDLRGESAREGTRNGFEVLPLPPALACIAIPVELLSDTPQYMDLPDLQAVWSARISSPELRKPPGRAAQQAQIAALERAVAAHGTPAAVRLAVTALIQGWQRFDDELVADRIGRNGNGKLSAKEAARIAELTAAGRVTPPVPIDIGARLAALSAALPSDLPGRDEWAASIAGMTGPAEAVESALHETDAAILERLLAGMDEAAKKKAEAAIRPTLAKLEKRLPRAEIPAARAQSLRQHVRRTHHLPLLSLFSPEAEST